MSDVENVGSENTSDTGSLNTGTSGIPTAPSEVSSSGADQTQTFSDTNPKDVDSSSTSSDTPATDTTSPETYTDFTLPKDMQLDEALLADAIPIFKDLGLTQQQAQKLVDFQAKYVEANSAKQIESFNELTTRWQEASKIDKEFGGDKFDESIAIAQSAIDKFGTPELKQLLDDHGVGNHPELIRFMVKVGKLTVEDVPSAKGTRVSPELDRVQQLYPNDRIN